ncbi:MAG TPA: hypothetical protein VGB46_06965, partial [Flavisolibacter sp.]
KGGEVEGGKSTVTTDTEEKNTIGKVKENEIKNRANVEKEKLTGGSDEDSHETMAKVPEEKKQKVVNRNRKPEDEAPLNTGKKNTKPAAGKARQDKPAADTQAVVMTPPAELPVKPEQENKKEETTKEAESETTKETEAVKEPQDAAAQEPPADTAVTAQSSNRQQQKNSKWTANISVTAGVSGMGEGLQFIPRSLTTDNLYNSPGTGGQPGMAPLPPSRVGNGFSFGAGYMVKRNTGKRLSYSTGLRYNYYSTSIAIGTRHLGDTSLPRNTTGYVSVNVFYTNALASTSFDARRRIYRNQYHFVSLPFDLEVKLGNIPLYATTGLSLQYMVATNALVYSPRSYVYYKDKEALNRLQLFGNIGLHYTFFQKKKHPVQLGPHLSYGLGMLEKQNRSYLFTAGITARMALGKKRI